VKTKQDLLRRMKSENACSEATEWVESFADGTPARHIWHACHRIDWMCWFAFRGRPKAGVRFACNEADIAIRVHAVNALRSAGLDSEADKLVSLPKVTRDNARAACDTAYYAAVANAAAYAANVANVAAAYVAAAAYAAANAAAYAAYSAANAAYAAAAERTRQAKALHALWDGKHGLEGRL
jgi:hypothetical protein